MEITINTKGATLEAIPKIITYANDRKIWLLEGNLGAGKTTFVQMIGQYLQVKDKIASPTYSIVNEYSYLKEEQESFIYHMDLYRLNDISEAFEIGIEDYLDSGNYCFIEWPEVIKPILPSDVLHISIETLTNGHRRFVLE